MLNSLRINKPYIYEFLKLFIKHSILDYCQDFEQAKNKKCWLLSERK